MSSFRGITQLRIDSISLPEDVSGKRPPILSSGSLNPSLTGTSTGMLGAITELLQHYFVPNPPSALDEKRSFEDLGDPAARAAIQHQLDEVSRTLQ